MKTWTWPAWLDNCAMAGGLLFFAAVIISVLTVIFLSVVNWYDKGPRRRRYTKQTEKLGKKYAKHIEGLQDDFKQSS